MAKQPKKREDAKDFLAGIIKTCSDELVADVKRVHIEMNKSPQRSIGEIINNH